MASGFEHPLSIPDPTHTSRAVGGGGRICLNACTIRLQTDRQVRLKVHSNVFREQSRSKRNNAVDAKCAHKMSNLPAQKDYSRSWPLHFQPCPRSLPHILLSNLSLIWEAPSPPRTRVVSEGGCVPRICSFGGLKRAEWLACTFQTISGKPWAFRN